MIMESVLLSPMNTYFKLLGKGFNSNSGAWKREAKTFYVKVLNQQRHYHSGAVCKGCKAKADSCMF